MEELLEQGLGVGMVGTVTEIGVIVRIILFGYYTRLGKACKQFEKTQEVYCILCLLYRNMGSLDCAHGDTDCIEYLYARFILLRHFHFDIRYCNDSIAHMRRCRSF